MPPSRHPQRFTYRLPLGLAIAAVAIAVAACGGGSSNDTKGTEASSLNAADWQSVLAKAKGQTVNWYMYGGDDHLNAYVNGFVSRELAKSGVKLNQVKIGDTVEAVNKVLGEKQAGRASGSVDLIWINGENFATGKQAKLWYCGYADKLPNAKNIDFSDGSIKNDFGVPIDNCEMPWNRSTSVVVYDSAKVPASAVRSVASMFSYVAGHPGSFTYPAPPDFTGSMAVRRFFYDANGGYESFLGPFDRSAYAPAAAKLWTRLNALEPSLWRKGKTYPQGQPDVEKLYGNGEISLYLTYDAGSVATSVDKGIFPKTTREAAFADGMIGNTNYVSIPYNAPHKAAALVLANLLVSPQAQLEKAKPDVLGYYPVLDTARASIASRFKTLPTPASVLPYTEQAKHVIPELQSTWLTTIEKDWKTNVLQK